MAYVLDVLSLSIHLSKWASWVAFNFNIVPCRHFGFGGSVDIVAIKIWVSNFQISLLRYGTFYRCFRNFVFTLDHIKQVVSKLAKIQTKKCLSFDALICEGKIYPSNKARITQIIDCDKKNINVHTFYRLGTIVSGVTVLEVPGP